MEDTLLFPDAGGPVALIFGCESNESGEIYRQVADGILGMGNNNNAFHSQVGGGGGGGAVGNKHNDVFHHSQV